MHKTVIIFLFLEDSLFGYLSPGQNSQVTKGPCFLGLTLLKSIPIYINTAAHCVKSVQIGAFFGPYSVQIQESTDEKKLRIWTIFTQ